MGDLRSQLKATSMKSLKKRIEQDDNMFGAQKSEYLQLEDGKTLKIRIFPAHPGGEDFYVARKCYWLPLTGQDGDTYRGTVNDSRLHGGTRYDIVEEYIKYAKKKVGNDADKLEALVGTGPKSNSLNPQFSWICYADIVRPDEELRAKLWEFKKMVRDQLNKLACSEDADEAIEVDPFTDPDEGQPINVTYNKNPNKKKGENFYDVAFPAKSKARPLTDEEIEYFMKQKPLTEIIGKYGIADFNRALDGLQNFDQENEIDLFEDEDWLEHLEEIKAQYDEDEEEQEEKPAKKTTKKPAKPAEEEEEEEEEKPAKKAPKREEDEFDDMDRTELKAYINENELEISVKKSMSDDDLRDAIRQELASQEENSEENNEPEPEEEEEEEEEKPRSKMSLADIKKKLGKK
jgi:hypothetical protein